MPISGEFKIVDPEMVYIIPAKAMAMTVVDLLFDGARDARKRHWSCEYHFPGELERL